MEAAEKGRGGSAEGRGRTSAAGQLCGGGCGGGGYPGADRSDHRRRDAAPDDIRRVQGAPASSYRVPGERLSGSSVGDGPAAAAA